MISPLMGTYHPLIDEHGADQKDWLLGIYSQMMREHHQEEILQQASHFCRIRPDKMKIAF